VAYLMYGLMFVVRDTMNVWWDLFTERLIMMSIM